MISLKANVVFAFLCNLICIRHDYIIQRIVIQQLSTIGKMIGGWLKTLC